MRLFQIDDLRALAEQEQGPCVSLYLPTHRAGRKETQEDPIRLKNAVADAKEQLVKAGYPKDRSSELLQPAADLVTSRDFWLERADGLALFLAPGVFHYYRVPLRLREEVVVADHFSVKQLIPLFSEDGRFYVLALSQKRIRFFEATRTSIQERAVPDMLKSIDDLRQFDEAQAQVQGHTMALAGAPAAQTNVVFHGQGSIADKATYKAEVMEYIQRRLQEAGEVPGCPDRSFGSGRRRLRASSLPRGQLLPPSFGRRHFWAIPMSSVRGRSTRRPGKSSSPTSPRDAKPVWRHFADLSHTDKTSDRLEEILPAACHGRVRTLFVQAQAHTWGKYEAEGLSVETHTAPAPGDVDLIDVVTVCVLQNKGMIYALPPDQMPVQSNVAALLRY